MKNIVLIGMPGTGKSTVGKALADRLGYDFVDADDLIVQTTGKTLPEILRQDGLEAFYKIENKVGTDLNRTHTVIATGGSMVLYPEAMAPLKEGSTVIWLQTPFSQLEKRMPADLYDRGIAVPVGTPLREIYEERCVLYARYADLIVVSQDGEADTIGRGRDADCGSGSLIEPDRTRGPRASPQPQRVEKSFLPAEPVFRTL